MGATAPPGPSLKVASSRSTGASPQQRDRGGRALSGEVLASRPLERVRAGHVHQQRPLPSVIEIVNSGHGLPGHIPGDTQSALPGQPHDAVPAFLEAEGALSIFCITSCPG